MRQPRLRAFLAGSFNRVTLEFVSRTWTEDWARLGEKYTSWKLKQQLLLSPRTSGRQHRCTFSLLLRCKSSYHVNIAAKLATHEPAGSVRATRCSEGAWRSSYGRIGAVTEVPK